ncbi:MAG: CBS domain-containing protein [Gammaproteobacteria bacterium]|nr:CBS domain-containing protein [Gammaproteobacteria bacterium]
MNLKNVIVPTMVASPGMKMREIFTECIRIQSHSIPFRDARGRLAGHVTLRNTMKVSCLPEYIVEMAYVLGSQLSCIEDTAAKAKEVLNNPVDPYVLKLPKTISSDAPIMKAVAVMEKNDTSYVFVVDEGEYKGVVTINGVAKWMLQVDEQPAA